MTPHRAVATGTPGAESGWLQDLEEGIDGAFAPVSEVANAVVFYPVSAFGVEIPVVVIWLILAAVVITVYLKVIQARGLRTSVEVVRGHYSTDDDPGEVPHFQALTSALSGTVGLGNIAGVGVAVTLGGPGATFWMVLAGLLGMATKFAECTLGVKYREVHEDGTVSGGPFRYLPVAFARLGRIPSAALTGPVRGRDPAVRRRRRQHVPGQPDLRPGQAGHRRRRRLPRQRRGRPAVRSRAGRTDRPGHPRRHAVDRTGNQPPGPVDGRGLRDRLPGRHRLQHHLGAGGFRCDRLRRVLARGRRRRRGRRHDHRVPARRLLQRGRARVGSDRALHRQDPPTRQRGLRRAVRAAASTPS